MNEKKQNKSRNSEEKIEVKVTLKFEEGEEEKRNIGRRNLRTKKKKKRNTYWLDFGVPGKVWLVVERVQ